MNTLQNIRLQLQLLTKLGFKENNSPVPNLDLKLSASELAKQKKTLYGIVQNDKKTICIFTLPPLTSAIRIMVGSFYDRLKQSIKL
jgi:hypothetical protein